MTTVAGVDGCKGGWATIAHSEDGALEVKVVEQFVDIRPRPDVVAIDVPIGLTEQGPRLCDVLARKLIGPRASSVFAAPVRSVLECKDYEQARRVSVEAQGASLSAQCFAIVPKISEVDAALREDPDLQAATYEVHPEVSFAAWNGAPLDHNKKSDEGKAQRLELVKSFFGRYAFTFAREFLPRSVQDDDILDAYAAAWTAWRIAAGIAESLPETPPTDSRGIQMAIWF
jgi:predicted RNase H-like nuclease